MKGLGCSTVSTPEVVQGGDLAEIKLNLGAKLNEDGSTDPRLNPRLINRIQ